MKLPVSKWTIGVAVAAALLALLSSLEGGAGEAEHTAAALPVVKARSRTEHRVEPEGPAPALPRPNSIPAPVRLPAPGSIAARMELLAGRGRASADVVELFGPAGVAPPASSAPAPAPHPKPVPPPFPYTIIGSLVDGPNRTLFMTKADLVLAVKVSETFDGVYRVERIDEREMTLLYLPLKQEQKISLGPQ